MPTPDLTNIGPIGPTGPSAEFGPPLPPEMEGPTGPTFEGAPSVKPGVINVISPDGEPMELDIDWLIKPENMSTFQSEGWSLPSKPMAQQDLERQGVSPGSILVISPTGEEQELDSDWLKNPSNMATFQQEGWKLGAPAAVEHNKKVNQDFTDLTTAGWSRIDERHAMDAVTDDDGNYKLLDLNGDPVLATRKQLVPLLSSGFRFQDPNFQSLYDANRRLASDTETAADVGALGAMESVPGLKWINDKITDNFGTAAGKASNIALDVAKHNEQSTAHTVGTVAGIGAQLGIPTGVFGEVKLAQAAKAGILGKLVPEGASFGKQLLAKGLGTAAEGAIITAPQAIAQLALDENPKAAAESIGIGAGLGLILGIGGPLLSKTGELGLSGLKKTAGAVEPYFQSKLAGVTGGTVKAELAKDLATSSTGMVEKVTGEQGIIRQGLNEVDDAFAKSLAEKGLKGKSKEKIVDGLRQLAEGERIAPLLPQLDKASTKLTGLAPKEANDLLAKLAQKTESLLDFDGQLGKISAQLDEKIFNLADKSGNITLENMHKFVKELGSDINWKSLVSQEGGTLENQIKSLYWGTIQEEMVKQIDSIVALERDAKLIKTWATEGKLLEKYYQNFDAALNAPKYELNQYVKAALGLATDRVTGAMAGTVGGPIGMIAGAGLADAAKPLTQSIETALIERYANQSGSKLGNFLVKNKLSQAIGSYLTVDAIKNMESKIGEIPQYLKDMGTVLKIGAIKVPAAFVPEKDPIKSILGTEANGLTKSQQFNRLSDRLAALSSSSEMMQKNFELYIAPIFKDHPQLAGQLYTDYQQKIQTLNQIVNMYNNKQPEAFTGKEKKFEPTPSQMAEIDGLLKVAMNPYALMDGLKHGRVTSKQVALVAELNPAILQKMREEIVKEAYSGKVNLPYQQRLTASIIMGAPLDPGLRNGSALQATYGKTQSTNQPPPKSQGNSKPLKADKISPYTAAQRITKL